MSVNFTLAIKTPFYILGAAFSIIRSPILLGLCIIPTFIGVATFVASLYLTFSYLYDITSALGFSQDAWYFETLSWGMFFVNSILSAILGYICAAVLGGYFVELCIEKLMGRSGLVAKSNDGSYFQIFMSILRALLNETILVVGIIFCTILAFILSFIPFLTFIPILTGVLVAGFTLYNLPLAILEIPLGRRLVIVKNQLLACMALGACFTLVLVIPLGNVILLPAFYGAAVNLLSKNSELKEFLE